MVNDAQWTLDGSIILTVSSDKTAILWDASTFRPRLTLKAHLGPVTRAAFSSDGKQAATISEDRTLRLWDVETGTLIATYAGHDKTIHTLALSREGRTAATASSDGTVRLWNAVPRHAQRAHCRGASYGRETPSAEQGMSANNMMSSESREPKPFAPPSS